MAFFVNHFIRVCVDKKLLNCFPDFPFGTLSFIDYQSRILQVRFSQILKELQLTFLLSFLQNNQFIFDFSHVVFILFFFSFFIRLFSIVPDLLQLFSRSVENLCVCLFFWIKSDFKFATFLQIRLCSFTVFKTGQTSCVNMPNPRCSNSFLFNVNALKLFKSVPK